jgi:hypothetical protein
VQVSEIIFSTKPATPVMQPVLRTVNEPTDEENREFFKLLANSSQSKASLPAILSVQPDYCSLFVPASRTGKYPSLLTVLYDCSCLDLDRAALLDKCTRILADYRASTEQIRNLEVDTRLQAKSMLWFAHRTGRVTSSVLRQCLCTSPENPLCLC